MMAKSTSKNQKPAAKGNSAVNQKVIGKSPAPIQQKEKKNNSESSDNNSTADNLNTGISEENSSKVAQALNQVLSDEFVLYTKTLNFHWNIEGRDFHALHLFLDDQYHQLQIIIDSVAERIRKVGHFATGSMKEFLADASLQEQAGAASVSESMIAQLAADHETLIRNLRTLIDDFDTKYDDAGSSDFVTGIMKEHEKMAWMLRASVPQAK
jgi:starvation-inducible DNA-binding protein